MFQDLYQEGNSADKKSAQVNTTISSEQQRMFDSRQRMYDTGPIKQQDTTLMNGSHSSGFPS